LPLVDDSVRTTNAEFFNKVVRWFDALIATANVYTLCKITTISGTTEERTAQILSTLELETI
jgi:hypothetical protein